MDITIRINTDNDAFAEYDSGEVGRVLRELADEIAYGGTALLRFNNMRLHDENGNTCGSVTVEP